MFHAMTFQKALATELGSPLLHELEQPLAVRRNNRRIEFQQILVLDTAMGVMAGEAGGSIAGKRFSLDVQGMVPEALVRKNAGAAVTAIAEGIGLRPFGNIVRRIEIIDQNIPVP